VRWGDLELEGRAGEGGAELACVSRMLDSVYKMGRIVLLNTAYPVWIFSLSLLGRLLFKLVPRRYSPSHRKGNTFSPGECGRIGGNEECECIVFSKDRALQLHALLSSYFEKTRFPASIHVLYHASTPSHERTYNELIPLFETRPVFFNKQTDAHSFRRDFLRLVGSIKCSSLFFLVDDIVFTEDVSLAELKKFAPEEFVPTLRMGLNLKRCYTMQQNQPLPRWSSGNGKDGDKVYWKWKDGAYDWGYPLSVDGHLFSTWEIIVMSRLSRFRGPNSFEHKIQKFKRLFWNRKGVCYRKSKIMNLPLNKVQEEIKNISGNIAVEFLREQWEQGFQMDYRQFYGFWNESAHQEVPIRFIKRH
jgi:hypothetical protein